MNRIVINEDWELRTTPVFSPHFLDQTKGNNNNLLRSSKWKTVFSMQYMTGVDGKAQCFACGLWINISFQVLVLQGLYPEKATATRLLKIAASMPWSVHFLNLVNWLYK